MAVKQTTEETLRIGELAKLSGLPVGTIKFYLREGLIPPGRATRPTQARYADLPLDRLKLVRVLAQVGDLSLQQIRQVLAAIDNDELPRDQLIQTANYALGPVAPDPGTPNNPELEQAIADVDRYVDRQRLTVAQEAPARRQLAEALLALRSLGVAAGPAIFDAHARAAKALARFEIGAMDPQMDRADLVRSVTVGSVVFGSAFAALR